MFWNEALPTGSAAHTHPLVQAGQDRRKMIDGFIDRYGSRSNWSEDRAGEEVESRIDSGSEG